MKKKKKNEKKIIKSIIITYNNLAADILHLESFHSKSFFFLILFFSYQTLKDSLSLITRREIEKYQQ